MRALLDAAKIEDIYSAGRWVADVLQDIEQAKAKQNWTAVASFRRMLGQALGVLKDRVIVATEQTMTNAELVATLAGDDENKAKAVALRERRSIVDDDHLQPGPPCDHRHSTP